MLYRRAAPLRQLRARCVLANGLKVLRPRVVRAGSPHAPLDRAALYRDFHSVAESVPAQLELPGARLRLCGPAGLCS